jgi:hypothetical protein
VSDGKPFASYARPVTVLRLMASRIRSQIQCVWTWVALPAAFVGASGCLDQPPSYDGQTRLPPYVVMASVIPNPGTLSVIEDGMMPLEVPFRSEDLGQSLRAAFFVDSEFYTDLEYGGSVFADETRKVDQLIGLDEGCHSVRLVLTHSDNLPRPSAPPTNIGLAAMVYWWAVVPPEEGEVHCPQ